MKMDMRAIRNEADYDWALREIETRFDEEPKRGTLEAERFDVPAALIEAYEAKRWPGGRAGRSGGARRGDDAAWTDAGRSGEGAGVVVAGVGGDAAEADATARGYSAGRSGVGRA